MTQVYNGPCVKACRLDGGFAQITFDNQNASVNKFDLATLKDLGEAVSALKKESGVKGLLINSAKDVFIVGADIMEFVPRFKEPDDVLTAWLTETHKLFNQIEDLPYPSVSLIGGICLGGGMELALSTTYRLASTKAKLGLPEVKLGIYPGWGGTIRLPRLVGADNAVEWIASGNQYSAEDALKIQAVDGVVPHDALVQAGVDLLTRAAKGDLNWAAKREEKLVPLKLITPIEAAMVFEGAKAFVAGQAGPNYPAPLEAIKSMQASAGLTRDQATPLEIRGFVKVAKTITANALVGIFLSDQFNKKKTGQQAKKSKPVGRAAVLGAGIMGGGIAVQSALKGTPILMKDIAPKSLELGMGEATTLLAKQVERGKLKVADVAKILATITPTLSYGDFKSVDVVVEAVVENEGVKAKVLAEVEDLIPEGAVLASNTSTISISRLAKHLKRPEQFCGMHFFNPVPKMPLVEIIRGDKTSEETISTVVAYALKMGKTPVVVNDCPGFLVNRVLFPYLWSLTGLIQDGLSIERIDKVMETFGWPMGPGYLMDVIGIDTGVHAGDVMAEAFPDRLKKADLSALTIMKDAGRYGQKTGKGFYVYTVDEKGRQKKKSDPETVALLAPLVKNKKDIIDEEIVDRMMIPMINEAALCLAEKIVDTPMEVDLGLLYGLGFPPFRGGAFKYLDTMGLSEFVKRCSKYSAYGKGYEAAPVICEYERQGKLFYA